MLQKERMRQHFYLSPNLIRYTDKKCIKHFLSVYRMKTSAKTPICCNSYAHIGVFVIVLLFSALFSAQRLDRIELRCLNRRYQAENQANQNGEDCRSKDGRNTDGSRRIHKP